MKGYFQQIEGNSNSKYVDFDVAKKVQGVNFIIRAAKFLVKDFLFIFLWGTILSKNCKRINILSIIDIAMILNT